MSPPPDPYRTLGIDPSASDAQLRAAYRRLVQRHHPDHNGGSAESARRFELVQEAYAEVRRRRAETGAAGPGRGRQGTARGADPSSGRGAGQSSERGAGHSSGAGAGPGAAAGLDPELEARLAAMEQELRAARDAREQTLRRARRAAEAATPKRPSDEELGYFSTDDSFAKIIDDAAAELSGRLEGAARSPAAHRVSELIDELASKLTGDRHRRS